MRQSKRSHFQTMQQSTMSAEIRRIAESSENRTRTSTSRTLTRRTRITRTSRTILPNAWIHSLLYGSSTTAHDSWWLSRCHDLPLIASLVRASKRWLPRRRSPHWQAAKSVASRRRGHLIRDMRSDIWLDERRGARSAASDSHSVSKMFQKYEYRGLTYLPQLCDKNDQIL